MEHFTKGSSEADEDEKQKWDIQVKGGSKMRNVISHALRLLKVLYISRIPLLVVFL